MRIQMVSLLVVAVALLLPPAGASAAVGPDFGRVSGGLLWRSGPPQSSEPMSGCSDPTWVRLADGFTVAGRSALQAITVNVAGLPAGVSAAMLTAAVGEAGLAWNDERNPCGRPDRSTFRFRVANTVSEPPLPTDDGRHMVLFAEGLCLSVLHVACFRTHTDAATGAPRGWDVVLDPTYPWGSGAGPWLDLQNVLTHELGHAVGLADLPPEGPCGAKNVALTMYACTWPGDTFKRDLGLGDALGVEAMSGA